MRKIRLLVTLLCLWLGMMPLVAQSVQIIKELEQNPFASAVVLYKNDFGSFEKPDLIDTFPYAVIRMHLEGDAHDVRTAKERLTLDVGQMFRVESRVTTYTNQIVFLVKAKRLYMLIDCGDGCEKVVLNNMEQLKSNCVYDCTVRYEPEKLNNEEAIDKEKLKQELLAELAAVLKEQGGNNITQNTDLPTSAPSNPQTSKPNKDSYETPDLQPNKHNGHEYVDLGLSVKWATCNVGANSPEEYGDYFAWGETLPKYSYDWDRYNYCYCNNLTKYCTNKKFGYKKFVDNKITLLLSDDAARYNWGGSWRMPTDAELTELRENCIWTWTNQNGLEGYKVTSKKNGNSIFLPAAGCRSDSSLNGAGSYGFYWSSSLSTDNPDNAWYVAFHSGEVRWTNYNRYLGLSVRPVCP